MPSYSYTNTKTGETVTREFSMAGDRPKSIRHKGRVFVRDIAADSRRTRNNGPDWKNTWFEFSGINPSQIPEMTAKLAKKGVRVEFHPKTGDVKFSGQRNRKSYHEAMGLVVRNGGYSDCTQNRDWS